MREVRTGALVVAVLALAGAVLGVVWDAIAPTVPIRVDENSELLIDDVAFAPQAFIATDGWFAVLAAVAGTLTGALVWWRLRRQPFGALIGIGLGGLLASLVMWRVGVWLGPPDLPEGAGLEPGDVLEGPRRLQAKGVLAIWSALAAGVYLALDLVTEDVPDDLPGEPVSEPAVPSSPA